MALRPARGQIHSSCLLFNSLALNSHTHGRSRGPLSERLVLVLSCGQCPSGKSIIWHLSVILQRGVFQAPWPALLYAPAVPRLCSKMGWRAATCQQRHAPAMCTEWRSTAMLMAAWGGSRMLGSRWRGALERCAGAGLWATWGPGYTWGCGVRPDPAEGGPGLSSGLSILSPQPWDSWPGVSPALGGAAASPQDQTGRSHSSKGRAKGFSPQA